MTGRFRVESCQPTGAGRYLIVYAIKGGVGSVYSDTAIPTGKDVSLVDGQIVRGCE